MVPLRRTPSNRSRRKPLATEQWLDDVLDTLTEREDLAATDAPDPSQNDGSGEVR